MGGTAAAAADAAALRVLALVPLADGVISLDRFLCFLYLFAGMNKMLINHLDKIFVTSDTATLLKELEVAHPAAKIMVSIDLRHARPSERRRLVELTTFN